jgi:hypothetical protein
VPRRANDGRCASLSAADTPDPGSYATCRGARDDAKAFAAAVAGPDADALRAYAALPPTPDADPAARRALAAAVAAVRSGTEAATGEPEGTCGTGNDLLLARTLRLRGQSLHGLGRDAEAVAVLERRAPTRSGSGGARSPRRRTARRPRSRRRRAPWIPRPAAWRGSWRSPGHGRTRGEASGLTCPALVRQRQGTSTVRSTRCAARSRSANGAAIRRPWRHPAHDRAQHEEMGALPRPARSRRAPSRCPTRPATPGSASALGNLGGSPGGPESTRSRSATRSGRSRCSRLSGTSGDGTTLANLHRLPAAGRPDRALSCYERLPVATGRRR